MFGHDHDFDYSYKGIQIIKIETWGLQILDLDLECLFKLKISYMMHIINSSILTSLDLGFTYFIVKLVTFKKQIKLWAVCNTLFKMIVMRNQ